MDIAENLERNPDAICVTESALCVDLLLSDGAISLSDTMQLGASFLRYTPYTLRLIARYTTGDFLQKSYIWPVQYWYLRRCYATLVCMFGQMSRVPCFKRSRLTPPHPKAQGTSMSPWRVRDGHRMRLQKTLALSVAITDAKRIGSKLSMYI